MHRLPVLVVAALMAVVPARAQDEAKARLDKSPRHGEWVKVKHGDRTVEAFIVYPEVKNKATAVVVIQKLPACNGKVAVGGFCWGGGQSFRFATNNKDIMAAFVFYGTGPTKAEDIERIRCPVYGFYGGNDARVGATVPKSKELMKAARKKYEPVTYDDAGHGFMRAGEAAGASEGNKKARDEAWQRWKKLLKVI
jgi:dienelactone hydrolase